MYDVSVVICSYNRAKSLRSTLRSLIHQIADVKTRFEIVVVDNNSNDETREVVKEFQILSKINMSYVFEPHQGVAFARNRGVQHAQGKVVAFVDDDVTADPHWLQSLWDCFTETGADAVGGRVIRDWNLETPDWYSEELGGCLIEQDFGMNRKVWDSYTRYMVTANFAVKKDLFSVLGYFRTELGRKGAKLVGGEDKEFYQRLLKAKRRVVYEPLAMIFHRVEPERLTKGYFSRWFWDIGRSRGHEVEWKWHYALTVSPFWIWREFLYSVGRYIATHVTPRVAERKRFASTMWLKHFWGVLIERVVHWLPFHIGERQCVFR